MIRHPGTAIQKENKFTYTGHQGINLMVMQQKSQFKKT